MRSALPAVIIALVTLLAACADASERPGSADVGIRPEAAGAVIATFDVDGERFRVRFESAGAVADARDLAERGGDLIPSGTLLPGSGDNAPWSWHIDPRDATLVEREMAPCDGVPSFVEAELTMWLEEIGRYCPFAAELVALEEIN